MIANLLKNLPSHDLSLPAWGPYSKRFFGLSHCSDRRYGHRFDLFAVPTLLHRTPAVPDVLKESQYLPWLASGDLEDYSYRQQLEWKNRIYADIAMVRVTDHLRLIRCDFVNHTGLPRDFALHLMAGMNLNPAEKMTVHLPSGGYWLDAALQGEVNFATPRITDKLNPDCRRKGAQPDVRAVGGQVLGKQFGHEPGDGLIWNLPHPLTDGETALLRASIDGKAQFKCNGWSVLLEGNREFQLYDLKVRPGCDRIDLVVADGAGMLIDGCAVVPRNSEPFFSELDVSATPSYHMGTVAESVEIGYQGIASTYALWWSRPNYYLRHFATEDFNHILYYHGGLHHPHLQNFFEQNGRDEFLGIAMQPISVAAESNQVVYALAADGKTGEAIRNIEEGPRDVEVLEQLYQSRIARCIVMPSSKWKFSQERMAAVALTNVVYPILVKDHYVRHHTPGRMWNSLYTWDSGFIGLGFLELDRRRALESLCAYLTEPGEDENAFVHHGSPVPVQIYLFHELWNRTQDEKMVRELYPSLKQYYDFLAGHCPGSCTRSRNKEALINTWDYCYNSGGWDDYPAQWAVHTRKCLNVCPVVPTAHLIRAARILRFAADFLGLRKDLMQFSRDVACMREALQRFSWDDEAGYFSYVVHDSSGNPTGFFRADDHSNFNQGLDGASPLIAGAATPRQKEILWRKLASPEHLWSPAGLSTVDRSASYYRPDGYWNGAVWMPYMYFFWKAALNDNQGDFAWKIARTALDMWERETQDSYCCFEHFDAENGRGGGWHHFSALSAPVLSFHAAYMMPERLTLGNDWHCLRVNFSPNGVSAVLQTDEVSEECSLLIVTLPCNRQFEARGNGQRLPMKMRLPGAWEVTIPRVAKLMLEIVPGENQ